VSISSSVPPIKPRSAHDPAKAARDLEQAVATAAGWLHLFVEPGQVVELRALNVKQNYGKPCPVAGFFDYEHLADMARDALELSRRAAGVYFTLNPLNTALKARRANRTLNAEVGFSASDKDVLCRRWLLIDADPCRVAGISASDDEKALALTLSLSVRDFLRERGWPDPLRADSGNGHHLLYRVDLPADDGELVKRVLLALSKQFSTDAVKLDTSVFNPARICKLYGTLARKGDDLPDRPHRRSQIIEVPGCADLFDLSAAKVMPVPLALLEALAAEAPVNEKPKAQAPPSEGNGEYRSRLKVGEWLSARGVEHSTKALSDGRTAYVLRECPFNPDHTGKDVAITQEPGGKLGAKCFHDSCGGNHWQEFKDKIGAPASDHYDPPLKPSRGKRRAKKAKRPAKGTPRPSCNGDATAPGTGNPRPLEADDDPHRLARLCLWSRARDQCRESQRVPAGYLKLRYWREEWVEWDGLVYRSVPPKEIRARVTDVIKAEFDTLNVEEQSGEGDDKGDGDGDDQEPPTARKVTTKLVTDTLQALASITLLSADVTPPAWLDGAGPFPAGEVLAAKNALVHLPSLVGGIAEEFSCPPRRDFFTFNALDYEFDPARPEAPTWLAFLDQLWPNDAQAVNTLQEWFGYCLLPDTSQHKILMIVGPKRSGKGTIARVLRGLVGVQNTASPTLAGLGTNFGLWPLLDKTLAIISDARLSGRTDVAVVTERLLSISGEDTQTIDRKNMSHVTVKLPVRFVILTNELPNLNDPSGALVGRLVLLRQTQSWYGKEDTHLTPRLLAELPGILHWALEGWRRLNERGKFEQPESGLRLVRQMEDLSSPIGAFLRENCVIAPGLEVPVRGLFNRWQKWCERVGKKDAGNEQTFGRDLRAAVPGIDDRQPRGADGSRHRWYVGIGLRAEETDESADDGIPD
jgi:putative DNA primase/helicase